MSKHTLSPLQLATREYVKSIDDKAAAIRATVEPKLTQLVIQSDHETVKNLIFISSQFTMTEVHILLTCTTPTTFYSLCNSLVDHHCPISEPKAVCDIVAKLSARKYVTLSEAVVEDKKPRTYIGTLTVQNDGTITFLPDEPAYRDVFNHTPLLTVKSNAKSIPAYRPIYVKGTIEYLNK